MAIEIKSQGIPALQLLNHCHDIITKFILGCGLAAGLDADTTKHVTDPVDILSTPIIDEGISISPGS
jgi:hypothetical protein